MSFPRYPNYKDSGVEWLGEVPAHWRTGSLRWLSRRYSGGTPDKTNLTYWENGTVPWLNSGAVNDRLIEEPSTYITEEAFANSSAKWIPEGSLVMALAGQGKTKGMVAQLAIRSTCNQSMAAIIPGPEIEARFLFWWLESNYQNIRNMAGGDLRDGLNLELLGNISCPLSSQAEQNAIAAFLDRETGKIDELVAEQRRLMELLKEKRQAVISHAVTRGLNPAAPLQPSGIEWLGDVPATWEVPSLGVIIAKAELGENHDSSEGNEGLPVMKMGNLDRGLIKLDKVEYLPKGVVVSESMILSDGDFLFNTRNSLDLVGKVAIWRGELARATYNSNILRIAFNPLKVATTAFMNYFFNSDLGRSQLRSLAKGTTSVAAIYYKDLTSLRVMLPPAAEQHAIVTRLNDACAQLALLTAEAQRGIALLQERRTALISAAVTGQIDVRNVNP